jgi:hypothetical protein
MMPQTCDTICRLLDHFWLHCIYTRRNSNYNAYYYFLLYDFQDVVSNQNTNSGVRSAYAHIFSDTEYAVTKNVDLKYQVAYLTYPATPFVNDTSTKLNFSVMEIIQMFPSHSGQTYGKNS